LKGDNKADSLEELKEALEIWEGAKTLDEIL
jgi:hypothetical protein